MDHLFGVNWAHVFMPSTPSFEIVIRGTVVYFVLYLLFRVLPRREAGAAGINDLLVVVLIADAAQNAMAASYTSLSDGLLLVVTIMFWSTVLNWVAYRWPSVELVLMGRSRTLVRDGKLMRRTMARELITREELMSQLRLQGVLSLENVKQARIEPDGRISVITIGRMRHPAPEHRAG